MTDPASNRTPPIRFGVRQKMILVLVAVLTLAMSTTTWFTIDRYQGDVLSETEKRGHDISRYVSESLVYAVIGYDYHTIQLLLDKLITTPDIVYAVVINQRGNVMGEAGVRPAENSDATLFNHGIAFDNERVGRLTIGLDVSRITKQMEEQKLSLIRHEIITVLLIALGEFLALSYIIIRPVGIISHFLKSQVDDKGEVRADIPLKTNDEFGHLARQFNDIRGQLSEANKRLKSQVDSADWQLKQTNEQLLAQSEELRRMNEELTRMSITDPLTGLYNRRHFEHLMATEVLLSLRHGEPNSILAIDLDHFKEINDTYGHQAGDRILRRIASLLLENLRRSDILCRVGGEEFVALCRRSNREQAMIVAEKLRRNIADYPMFIGTERVFVTISIGVASLPNDFNTKTSDDLLEQADNALYFSKSHGRNRTTHFGDIVKQINSQFQSTT